MGNGKWEIDCVLPDKRMDGSVETGNGKLLPNKRCQGPSGKWEMGNWMWMRRIGQVGNGKWEIAEWEIGCCAAASIRETGNGKLAPESPKTRYFEEHSGRFSEHQN